MVKVRQYDGQACINVGNFIPGHEIAIFNNSCILPLTGSNGKDPSLVAASLGDTPCDGLTSGVLQAHSNRYYTATNNATIFCDGGVETRVVDLPPPMEAGSSSGALPDIATILSWGKEKLGLP